MTHDAPGATALPAPRRTDRAAVDDACRYLSTWLDHRRTRDRVPGVQAAVLADDDVVLSEAYGVASQASGEALTTGHLFHVASHSKTFTATLVLLLVQDGRLRLDDALGAWLPELADGDLATVTVRELLSHGGGVVRDGRDGDFWQLWHPFPDADGLTAVARDAAAVLRRNERFKYSNVGYSLLGRVVEVVTGRSWAQELRTRVLDPLGLTSTGPDHDPAQGERYAAGHSGLAYADRRLTVEHGPARAMAPATGVWSTAADLVRWAAAHFHGDERLLAPDWQRVMQRTEWDVDGSGEGYALGWAVVEAGGRRLLGHGGGWPGHITRTLFDPADRVAVSVLTNAVDGPAQTLVDAAWRLVDLAAGRSDATSEVDVQPADALAGFRGRFASLWGVSDVVDLGGRLYLLAPEQADPTADAAHLERVDADTLRVVRGRGYGAVGEHLRFDRADDGSVRSVRLASSITAYPVDTLRAAVTQRERITLQDPLRP
ncbi:serine hydrolase domain-containing protein [Thalassiella azotivora]